MATYRDFQGCIRKEGARFLTRPQQVSWGVRQRQPIIVVDVAKYRVLLNARDVTLELEGQHQRGGFYIHACVAASSDAAAREEALNTIRANPKYRAFLSGEGAGPPQSEPVILFDEVERLPWWDSHELGIDTGFVFYMDPDEPPLQ